MLAGAAAGSSVGGLVGWGDAPLCCSRQWRWAGRAMHATLSFTRSPPHARRACRSACAPGPPAKSGCPCPTFQTSCTRRPMPSSSAATPGGCALFPSSGLPAWAARLPCIHAAGGTQLSRCACRCACTRPLLLSSPPHRQRLQMASQLVFPSQRHQSKAVAAVEVVPASTAAAAAAAAAEAGGGEGAAGEQQAAGKQLYTFCLERVTQGPYKNCWMTVGVRVGDYANE